MMTGARCYHASALQPGGGMAKGKGMGGAAAASAALVKAQFVLRREQVVALRRAALEKQASGEPGRADASAVLRDVLDRWMKGQK